MKPYKELAMFALEKLQQIQTAGYYSSIGGFGCMIASGVSDTVNGWIQLNIDYITIAIFFVAAAHVLGSIVHKLYFNDFDWKKNIVGFIIMLSMVVIVGLVMEGLAHLTKEENLIYIYIKMIGRLIVCIYPARSILKSVKVITNGRFPPDALIGKFEKFDQNLDLNEFRDKQGPNDNYNQPTQL